MRLLGDGVNAAVLLKRSKAEGSGWIVITAGWAFAVLCGIFAAMLFGSGEGHLNPAITLAFAFKTGSYAKLAPYALAQIAGAFCGAALVWLQYLPHWKITEDQGLKLGVFCTAPAVRSLGANLISEIIATTTLIVIVGAMSSKLVLSSGAAAGVTPYLVSCLVWGIGLSLGGTTGYAINPARDFGPRLAHAALPIAGKGGSDWGYAGIPIVGPAIGGMIAGFILRWIGA